MSNFIILQNSLYYDYLTSSLLKAKKSFYVSIFTFNLVNNQDDLLLVRNLTKLIHRKKKEGLDIKIILGTTYKGVNLSSKPIDMSNEMVFTILNSWKVPIAYFNRKDYESSHCKYFIIDDKLVVIGSHNFSPRAFGVGIDDSIGIQDEELTSKLKTEFLSDWSKAHFPGRDSIIDFNTKNIMLTKSDKRTSLFSTIKNNGKIILLPDKKYFQTLISSINLARYSIDIVMFYFSYSSSRNHITSKIFNSIKTAISKGVNIRCILDRDAVGDIYSSRKINKRRFEMLKKLGVSVKYDQRDKVTHSKLVVIDKSKVIIGSHNWTAGSFEKYRDMSLLIESTNLASEYHRLYNKRFK